MIHLYDNGNTCFYEYLHYSYNSVVMSYFPPSYQACGTPYFTAAPPCRPPISYGASTVPCLRLSGPTGMAGPFGPTGYSFAAGTGQTGTTGTRGAAGVQGMTGYTGPVGPTGSTQSLLITNIGPNSTALTANSAAFITNTALVTSSSSTAKFMIMVTMQARNASGGSDYLLTTIGRTVGNIAPTTANATNLANNIVFSTTDIDMNSVNTYMMAGSCTSGTALGNSMTFVDTPGVGTFTYSVRTISNSALSLYQFYMNVVQVNA